ncbi:MAG: GlsB/YeaQ/YmgE family stress response membrane protein [Comamonadaceae bacterium]|nr:MAG: GlsB/YeaQ/YmgE family stress response membrane protein [Comamonadaceae bacterium]
MSLLWTILIGFIVGLLARAVMPGSQRMGFILTTILGIVGSLAATYLGQAMGWYTAGAGAGFLASLIGAIVVLAIFGMVRRKA